MATLGIQSDAFNADQLNLVTAAAGLFGLLVETRRVGDFAGLAGMIVRGGATAAAMPPDDVPTLEIGPETEPVNAPGGKEVDFGQNVFLPSCLRGRQLLTPEANQIAWLARRGAEETLVAVAGKTIWALAQAVKTPRLRVATPLPGLKPDERLCQLLNGESFLRALPVYLFARAVAPGPRWEPPPLRACLVVDDPNLHWISYGRINYPLLAAFARAHRFHAAMAMVPLDTWWTHAGAAALFRNNADVVSLLVHGNNHKHFELADPALRHTADELALEALTRMEQFEQQAALPVDRVMAPPHGVCRPEMMAALARQGYEGMTTNRWSLWKHNPPSSLPADTGMRPADILDGGCPVVNRFRFRSEICRNEIVIAALLGQPVIPYGHHLDFANNMDAVRHTAEFLNGLGEVKWMRMADIFATNFEQHVAGGTLHLRPYARHVRVQLPDGVNAIHVEAPAGASASGGAITFRWRGAAGIEQRRANLGERIEVPAKVEIKVTISEAAPNRPSAGRPRRRPQLWLRRLAAELRDRLLS